METYVKRNDGTDEVFSWTYCCEFKQRSNTHDLVDAMRESVESFIMAFRIEQEPKCCLCGTTHASFHVDHVEPFRNLIATFLKDKTYVPNTFLSKNLTFQRQFMPSDDAFKEEWIAFHNSKCTLQILCAKCNLHKH